MSKKLNIFEALDKGKSKNVIMKEFDISNVSYNQYLSQWKKHKIRQEAEKKIINEAHKILKTVPIEGMNKLLQKDEKSEIFITVDLTLMNGTILTKCSLYYPGVKPGDRAINDIEIVEKLLNKDANHHWMGKMINVQNDYITAQVNVDGIDEYKIHIEEF